MGTSIIGEIRLGRVFFFFQKLDIGAQSLSRRQELIATCITQTLDQKGNQTVKEISEKKKKLKKKKKIKKNPTIPKTLIATNPTLPTFPSTPIQYGSQCIYTNTYAYI